jgi:hypothetical protein
LKNSAFLTWVKQQKRSLVLVLFPYSIPVLFPALSLLRISSVRQKSLKMPMESRFLNAWREKTAVFSLYFSLLTGIRGRDGFAGDWHHRQTVPVSTISRKPATELEAAMRPNHRLD